jgi:rhodanese-related sulfurtransferase
MKKVGFIILLNIIACISAYSQDIPDSVKFRMLEPYDFHLQYMRTDPALLVDVREVFEYKGKRIREAVNIPSSGNLEFAADTIDKECALFFYCTTDYRSNRVARFFYDKGFRKLYSLDGGISRWKKEGMGVVKRTKRRRD